MKPSIAVAAIVTLITPLLAFAAAGPVAGRAAELPSPPARPLVLLIHGRGHAGSDTAALRRRWQDALNDGARAVVGAPLLADGDVATVWYADALDPMSPERCTAEQLAQARRRRSGDDGLGAVLSVAGQLLAAVASDAGGDGARELRNFAGDLQYFGDAEKRCASERRLAVALERAAAERRPVIVVAHSMGALLSWNHLQQRPAESADALPPIARLVTVGSPVGSRDVRALLTGDGGAAIALPARVGSWINVVDGDDPFAAPLGAAPGLADVRTRTAATGDPHEITRYLRDPATATAVFGGWCAAFTGDRPAPCTALTTVAHD